MAAGPAEREQPVIDFTGLYRAYAGDVHRFALFLSGGPAVADDIVSEIFIRLWHARARLDLATVKGYLFAIARNLHLRERRGAHRAAQVVREVADPPPGPEEQLHARGALRTVLAAMQQLPEVDRAALLMRGEDDMPYEEIARALGISAGAARVKIHRARLKLAQARLAAAPMGTRKEPER